MAQGMAEKDGLDKRLDERDRREAKDNLTREQRARGAQYAPKAFNALCADVKRIVADYKKRARDSTITVSENHGFLAIHRGPFPAFHMEVHPPRVEPLSNLIRVEGWLITHKSAEREYLSVVVEVLPDDDTPGQYVLYHGDGLETVDATVPEQILSRIFDALMVAR
jgi:hypothetical protein